MALRLRSHSERLWNHIQHQDWRLSLPSERVVEMLSTMRETIPCFRAKNPCFRAKIPCSSKPSSLLSGPQRRSETAFLRHPALRRSRGCATPAPRPHRPREAASKFVTKAEFCATFVLPLKGA